MYKILVVEDDAVIAGQIGKYLEKWGYEVESVRDFSDVMAVNMGGDDFVVKPFDPEILQ